MLAAVASAGVYLVSFWLPGTMVWLLLLAVIACVGVATGLLLAAVSDRQLSSNIVTIWHLLKHVLRFAIRAGKNVIRKNLALYVGIDLLFLVFKRLPGAERHLDLHFTTFSFLGGVYALGVVGATMAILHYGVDPATHLDRFLLERLVGVVDSERYASEGRFKNETPYFHFMLFNAVVGASAVLVALTSFWFPLLSVLAVLTVPLFPLLCCVTYVAFRDVYLHRDRNAPAQVKSKTKVSESALAKP